LNIPNRPSSKGFLLILHFEEDVKRLGESGRDYPWPRPDRCPGCDGRRLWGHGYVRRYFEGCSEGIWIKRYRCPDCRAVHTLRPQGFYRGFFYSRFSILIALLHKLIHNRWSKSLSRQVQQYWWRGFQRQASYHRNRKQPDLAVLFELLRDGILAVTHSLQCEILRL
jgi:hypothetical protein